MLQCNWLCRCSSQILYEVKYWMNLNIFKTICFRTKQGLISATETSGKWVHHTLQSVYYRTFFYHYHYCASHVTVFFSSSLTCEWFQSRGRMWMIRACCFSLFQWKIHWPGVKFKKEEAGKANLECYKRVQSQTVFGNLQSKWIHLFQKRKEKKKSKLIVSVVLNLSSF